MSGFPWERYRFERFGRLEPMEIFTESEPKKILNGRSESFNKVGGKMLQILSKVFRQSDLGFHFPDAPTQMKHPSRQRPKPIVLF